MGYFISLLLVCSLAGCATQPPRFREQAVAALARVKTVGGETLPVAEYQSAADAFVKGEWYLKEGEADDAERYYYLTVLKGALLEQEIALLKARQREEALRAEELKEAELLRQAQEQANRLAQAKAEEAQAQKESAEVTRKKVKPQKEHTLVSSYTVRRGESLPLIASQAEVYGDRNLWPLIYRANRDQIGDPRHIWPGQVLRIPRNVGREEITEARRYAQERPLH